MGIIFNKDKRSGITYAYENHAYWDKEKKQCRAHRTLIGRVNENGDIVPTDGRCRKNAEGKKLTRLNAPGPITRISRNFYGATYLFDEIGRVTGLTEDLKKCFPEVWSQILSIAYFLILDDNGSLMHFPRWSACHSHPFGQHISAQRCSELFASVTEEAMRSFFRLQGKRRAEKEYWAYDSTSFSSYSETLNQVRYGKDKEYDMLPQINLLLLFGEQSGLPFYYRKISGNITDVKTVRNLLEEIDIQKNGKIKLVMDRGVYSENHINRLFQNHEKFIIGAECSLKYIHEHIAGRQESIRNFEHFNSGEQVYHKTETLSWNYKQERPGRKDVVEGHRRLYLHVYYNPQEAVNEEIKFNTKLHRLQEELESGKRQDSHEEQYDRYFNIGNAGVGGMQITPKEENIRRERDTHGYFALITNEIKDPMQALHIYRTKDVIEKAFGNIKERLNCRKEKVSSEDCLNGKLFVEFIALMIISYIHRKMQVKKLYEKYTMTELLEDLELVQSYCEPGRLPIVGEILQRQKDIYRELEVNTPK